MFLKRERAHLKQVLNNFLRQTKDSLNVVCIGLFDQCGPMLAHTSTTSGNEQLAEDPRYP